MNKYLRLLFDREFRFSVLTARGLYKNMPDEKFIEKNSSDGQTYYECNNNLSTIL